ncbi:MAG: hypothetical protein GXO08_06055 [Aquificae bacterium]|nr:hypothetical protein [Aquificota bacterium]
MGKRRKVFKVRLPVTNKVAEMLVPHPKVLRHLKKGDRVVVESERGTELVEYLGPSEEHCPSDPVVTFLRKPTYLDREKFRRYRNRAKVLFRELSQKAEEYGLNLRPLEVYVPLDNRRIFFYYTAPQRVDFRKFIRDMSKRYGKRIEMRQVGVRDAVQMKGGLGVCGHKVCCSNFMERFRSVGLDFIAEQNLPHSPSKFTGLCGRLKCCLAFEKGNYAEKRLLPPVGTEVCLLEGKRVVEVLEIDPIRKTWVYREGEAVKEAELALLAPEGFERIARSYDCVGCACDDLFTPDEVAEGGDFRTVRRFY